MRQPRRTGPMAEHCTTYGRAADSLDYERSRRGKWGWGMYAKRRWPRECSPGLRKRLIQKGRLLGWNYPMRRSFEWSFARLDEALGHRIHAAEKISRRTKVPSHDGKTWRAPGGGFLRRCGWEPWFTNWRAIAAPHQASFQPLQNHHGTLRDCVEARVRSLW